MKSPCLSRTAPAPAGTLALLLTTVAACTAPAPRAAKPVVEATADTVKVARGDRTLPPMRFAVAPAQFATPLPLLPVTARVTTVETLTSPSYAPLSGRVVTVKVRLGDHVKAGDPLIEVRTAELSTLEHDLRAAQLSIKTRQAMVDRLKQLVSVRIAAESELTVAQSELEEAKLAAVQAADRIRGLSLEGPSATTYWVSANRAGTVVQLDASPGQQVSPDKGTPIATVADLNELLVLADVPQRDAPKIAVGEKASIHAADGLDLGISGTVESVSEVVDPERQTVPVRVRVTNQDHKLRANSFVSAVFEPRVDERVVVVPSSAVVSDGAQSVVFVEIAPGTFKKRQVELGRQSPDKVEVRTGLKAEERVVTSGALLLLNALDVEG